MEKTPTIRITRQFRFEAAHALWNYDGPCQNIHGHSYLLYVTVQGRPLDDPRDHKHGMVMDFSVLKLVVNRLIVDPLDHALLVNAATPHSEMAVSHPLCGKVVAVPYQPTCENMISDFADKIREALPEGVRLHSLKLHETSTSYAEWFAEDNPR